MTFRNLPSEPGVPPVGWLMQPGEAESLPFGNDWLHEIKQDGWRLAVRTDGRGGLRLSTRGGGDRTWEFKRPLELLACAGRALIMDGEIAVPDERGVTDLRDLQAAMRARDTGRLAYYAFDLLWLDGRDLRDLPIEERKAILCAEIAPLTVLNGSRLLYVDHVIGVGQRVLDCVRQLGGEGVVSKQRGSAYAGAKLPVTTWLKTKLR